MPITQVHYILESFLADRCEILRNFQLRFTYYEIQHHFLLVARHELVFVDGVA